MSRPFAGKWDDPFGMDESGAFFETRRPGLETTLGGAIRLRHDAAAGLTRLDDDRAGLVLELAGEAHLLPTDGTAQPARDVAITLGETTLLLRLLDLEEVESAAAPEVASSLAEAYARSRGAAPGRIQLLSRPRAAAWRVAAAAVTSFASSSSGDAGWEEVLALVSVAPGRRRRAIVLVAHGPRDPGLLDRAIRALRWEGGTA